MSKVSSIPKVIGGYTPAHLERAKELYGHAIQTLVPVSQFMLHVQPKFVRQLRTDQAKFPESPTMNKVTKGRLTASSAANLSRPN